MVPTVDVNVSSRQTRPEVLGANSGRTVRVAGSASTVVPITSKQCPPEVWSTGLPLASVFAVSTRGKPTEMPGTSSVPPPHLYLPSAL